MNDPAPRVLGLDLSITATGIAFPDGTTHTLRPHTNGDQRLLEIVEDLTVPIMCADLVVIEGPVVRSNAAVTIGMVHGAIRTLLLKEETPYATVPPATLKKYATGRGNATKPDMRMELYKRTGIDLGDDNQVDAWWLQAAGLHHLGHPPVDLPKTQVDVLEKIEWP